MMTSGFCALARGVWRRGGVDAQGMAAGSFSLLLLAELGGEHPGEAPVLRLHFIDDDVRVFREFSEDALQGPCDFSDDLRFLRGGRAVFGDADVYVGHG